MRRNNLCIRSTSSVGQKLPDDWEAKAEKFRLYVKEDLCVVDPAHFGNMDEVPFSFDLPGPRTVHLKGAKEVSVAITGHEKSNFTVVLSVTSDGGKLPPLVVFKRKTLPNGNFPKGILIAANEKGWINQDIMKVWVEKVWRKRKQSFFNPKSLLIMDSCRAHITDTKWLVSKYSKLAIIPGGLTKKIQPLDLSVNKSFKSKQRSTWERWMMTGVKDYTESGKIKRVSYEEIIRWILW
jgi:hypothetical protein